MLKPATPKRLADRESTVAWPGASRVRSIRAGPRTSVLAVAATLAGFGLTALWVRYKAEALPPTEAPLQSLESVAPPRAPEAIAAPTLRSPVVSTASAAASLTSTPSATPSASGLAAPMPRPRKADTRSKSRGAGIAQGLELSTKEP